jgi:hypothetical protein
MAGLRADQGLTKTSACCEKKRKIDNRLYQK